MDEKDYLWIEDATHREIESLRQIFYEAKEEYEDTEEELEEEKEIMQRIGRLIGEIHLFEQDFGRIIENKEYEYGNSDVEKLKDIYNAVLRIEREIDDLRKVIHEFKSHEKADLKKSKIMEKRIDYVEVMIKKIRRLLRFND